MNFTKLPIFAAMAGRMAWLIQRQEVLAANIANANTPGYRPRDLEPLDFAALLRGAGSSMAVARTRPGHIAGTVDGGGFRAETKVSGAVATPSGNTVVLEKEMMKVAENQMNYSLVTNLYNKHMSLIRLALGRGG